MNAGEAILELLKAVLKPGYLYGVGKDGELYCVGAEIPEPGKTIQYDPMLNCYQKREEPVTTNADRIRAMSDQQLADYLWGVERGERGVKFIGDWLQWLQSPAGGDTE